MWLPSFLLRALWLRPRLRLRRTGSLASTSNDPTVRTAPRTSYLVRSRMFSRVLLAAENSDLRPGWPAPAARNVELGSRKQNPWLIPRRQGLPHQPWERIRPGPQGLNPLVWDSMRLDLRICFLFISFVHAELERCYSVQACSADTGTAVHELVESSLDANPPSATEGWTAKQHGHILGSHIVLGKVTVAHKLGQSTCLVRHSVRTDKTLQADVSGKKKPAWIMVGAPAPHAFQDVSVPIYIELRHCLFWHAQLFFLPLPIHLLLFHSRLLPVVLGRHSFSSFILPQPSPVLVAARRSNGNREALTRPIPPVTYIRQAVAIISGVVRPLNTSACLARVVHSRLAAPSGDPCPAAHTRSSRGRDAPCIRLLLADQGPHTRRSRRPHPSVPSLPLLQFLFFSRRVAHSEFDFDFALASLPVSSPSHT